MCGIQNFQTDTGDDPRFDDLRRLNMPRAWLMLAEAIGFDAFLRAWRLLSSEAFNEWVRRESGGTRMPMLRSFDSYLRQQRNRYIRALAAAGMTPQEARRAVEKNMGERLDETTVAKIMKSR